MTSQLISVNPSKTLIPIEELIRLAEQDLEKSRRQGIKDRNKKPEPQIVTPTPQFTPTDLEYQFLTGDFGRDIDAGIQIDYQDIPAIQVVRYNSEKGVVVGSNPFYVVAVNRLLRVHHPEFRTATQGELEKVFQQGILPIKDTFYEDSALVLRSLEDPNSYLANNLAQQLIAKGFNQVSPQKPLVVWLNQLDIEKDEGSPHKLSFKLTDETSPFYVPILSSTSGSKFDESNLDSNGFPKSVGNGTRNLWTRDSGLSRVCLSGGGNLGSNVSYLSDSDDCGRVVLAKPRSGGAMQNLGGNQ